VSRAPLVWAALGTVYVLWGSTYLGIAVAGESIPGFVAASIRFLAAGAILGGFLVVRHGWRRMKVTPRQLAAATLVGGLLMGSNALLFRAEQTVPTSLAALIFCTVPLVVTALRFATGQRPPAVVLVAMLVGFTGVAILLHPDGGATWSGLALTVVAAVGWAVGSFLVAFLPMPEQPLTATAWEMLAGGLVLLPLAVVQGWDPSEATTRSWLGIAYLVVFGSLLGFTAYSWLLGHAPIGLVATYAFVNPVVAIVLGILLLDETLSARTILGALVTLGAVAVVVRREAADAAPAGVEPRP
jgi:drug/metabolite transporter (DMT)-like permease